jgi:multisubunit Na+/H+ antiporter MnhG subunit
MSLLRDTFETYNPITLGVGCLFVACGVWAVLELLLHGVRTVLGGIVVVILAVFVPVSIGAAIIHNQLRLRKNSN